MEHRSGNVGPAERKMARLEAPFSENFDDRLKKFMVTRIEKCRQAHEVLSMCWKEISLQKLIVDLQNTQGDQESSLQCRFTLEQLWVGVTGSVPFQLLTWMAHSLEKVQ